MRVGSSSPIIERLTDQNRSDHRRAVLYQQRAKALSEQAAHERFEDRRRHLLDLVETYERAAEQLEGLPRGPRSE